jgi:hypothetical protein
MRYYSNANSEMSIKFLLMTGDVAEAADVRLTAFVLTVATSLQANVF